jgi:hypothetical protein
MLLNAQELQDEIISSLGGCKKSLVILSAFIKSSAFDWFSDQIKSRDINVTVVARWRLDDLVSHVSDLDVYRQCKEKGWTFKIDERLHSKLFLIDSDIAYVGSSNLTGAGFGLSKYSNFELSTKIEVTEADVKKVNKYIDSCITMTDHIYDLMDVFIDNIEIPKSTPNKNKWPSSIKDLLEYKIDVLWVDELFFVNYSSKKFIRTPWQSEFDHDLLLLGTSFSEYTVHQIRGNPNLKVFKEKLRDNLRQTKAIKWLKNKLLEEESRTLGFGAISKLLHTALLDDPKPSREEVKRLQSSLFSWIKELELSEFRFDKYNYRESISLIDQ